MKPVLFLTTLLGLIALTGSDYKLSDGTVCPVQGKAESPKVQDLNKHKNRDQAPAPGNIDGSVTLHAMLAPAPDGDDDRFSQEKAATIQGFVVSVKTSQTPESCNCYADKPVDEDTHIEVALSKHAPGKQCVIVEVTPRLRKLMANANPHDDWSTNGLRGKLTGKWVQFTGWLTWDFMHADKSENSQPGHAGNFRATAWEIHPVTAIRVLAAPPPEELAPSHMAAFQAAASSAVSRDPARQDAMRKRLAGYLKGLTPRELQEKEAEDKEH
jgi:hypothetical protein